MPLSRRACKYSSVGLQGCNIQAISSPGLQVKTESAIVSKNLYSGSTRISAARLCFMHEPYQIFLSANLSQHHPSSCKANIGPPAGAARPELANRLPLLLDIWRRKFANIGLLTPVLRKDLPSQNCEKQTTERRDMPKRALMLRKKSNRSKRER